MTDEMESNDREVLSAGEGGIGRLSEEKRGIPSWNREFPATTTLLNKAPATGVIEELVSLAKPVAYPVHNHIIVIINTCCSSIQVNNQRNNNIGKSSPRSDHNSTQKYVPPR